MTTKPTDIAPAWRNTQTWLEFLNSAVVDFGAGDIGCAGLVATGDVAVEGTIYHGSDTRIVPGSAFQNVIASTATMLAAGVWSVALAGQILAPVHIDNGRRISTIAWHYNRGAAGNMTFALQKTALGGAAVNVDTVTVSTGTGWFTETRVGLDYTVGADPTTQLFLSVTMDNAAQSFAFAEVTYDRLAP